MPGYSNRPPSGYLENEYAPAWPGLITSLPPNAIPPGSLISGQSMNILGRLQPQPGIFPVTGTGGMTVSMPSFAVDENVCAIANLQPPGSQQGFTVIITNTSVYADWVLQNSTSSVKTFAKIFTFPAAYPRYARFGTCVIGNVLYFSSASQLGVYALMPTFSLDNIEITNPGGYFSTPPAVIISDGGGSGATAITAIDLSGNLTQVNLTAPGSGYISPPLISFNSGSTTGPQSGQQAASAVGILNSYASGYIVKEISAFTGVAFITVTASGSGYYSPQVQFIGGGGTGAAGQVYLNENNQVSGIMVTSFGRGYTSAPTVQIVDATGTGATATCTLFNGKPFIGGDFMATMNERLILGNVIGGDGNNTASIGAVIVTNGGGNYNLNAAGTFPMVSFVGGNGTGAGAYVPPSAVTNGPISSIAMGVRYTFTGNTTSGSNTITNVSAFDGLIVGMSIETGDLPSGTKITAITASADTLTVSNNATATAANAFVAYNYNNDSGRNYSSTPTVDITAGVGSGAVAIAQLSSGVSAASSTTLYPDRVAWSAPNAYGFFDPNFLESPGGFNTLTEARGMVTSVNCVESVVWIGHNGGITEITPNTASAAVPFGFYPLWGSDPLQLVRYGSAAQFGSTVCFLSMDSAYTITPSGVSEIGQNIASLLRNAGIWNNGQFPNQGIYGSIVEISGQKHYLIGLSADDPNLRNGNSVRSTQVFDYNMNEGNWNTWAWSGITLTCPIVQSIDTSYFEPSITSTILARDSWILAPFTTSVGAPPLYLEQAAMYELAPFNRAVTLMSIPVYPYAASVFSANFRTESPSIARMIQERRIAFEYENVQEFTTQPNSLFTLSCTLSGQLDPTSVTNSITVSGTVYAVPYVNSQTFSYNGSYISGGSRTVFTGQADFSTFAGVCTSLSVNSSNLISLVRLTQISTLPKQELT